MRGGMGLGLSDTPCSLGRGTVEDTGAEECRGGKTVSPPQLWPSLEVEGMVAGGIPLWLEPGPAQSAPNNLYKLMAANLGPEKRCRDAGSVRTLMG